MDRLMVEWRNRDADGMQAIREALAHLRDTTTYEENLIAVALHETERRSDDPHFIARLLMMLADRPISVIQIQRVTGMHEGHLYRFLKRAGVDYKGATARRIEVESDHRPWVSVFADPLAGTVIQDGVERPAEMTLVAEDDRMLTMSLAVSEEEGGDAPLPIWPRLRLRVR